MSPGAACHVAGCRSRHKTAARRHSPYQTSAYRDVARYNATQKRRAAPVRLRLPRRQPGRYGQPKAARSAAAAIGSRQRTESALPFRMLRRPRRERRRVANTRRHSSARMFTGPYGSTAANAGAPARVAEMIVSVCMLRVFPPPGARLSTHTTPEYSSKQRRRI